MSKRPELIDFHSICEGILARVCQENKLSPEERAELCKAVLRLSVDDGGVDKQVEWTSQKYSGSEAYKVAFAKFRKYLSEALSNSESNSPATSVFVVCE